MKLTEKSRPRERDKFCSRCSSRIKPGFRVYWGGQGEICDICFEAQRRRRLEWIERCWKVADGPLHHSWPRCTFCKEAPQHKDYLDAELGICIGCRRSVDERWGDKESRFRNLETDCIVCRQNYAMKDYDLCKYCNWLDCWHRKQRGLAPRKVGDGIWTI